MINNFGLANFGQNIGKSASPNAAKVNNRRRAARSFLGQGIFLGIGTVR